MAPLAKTVCCALLFAAGAAAAAGDAACRANGGCDHALLQRVSSVSRRALATAGRAARNSSVTPFDCDGTTVPIQVLRQNGAYGVYTLDMESGQYAMLYSIPYDRTSPRFRDLNGCGISPVDDIVYCVMKFSRSESYLVRLDAEKVEFVARTPTWSWKATFAEDGTFYVVFEVEGETRLYRVPEPNAMPGFANRTAEGMGDLSTMKHTMVMVGYTGADIAVMSTDLEGVGTTEYLVSMANGKIIVCHADGMPRRWELSPTANSQKLPVGTVNAAWHYRGRFFFGSNAGGIYEAIMSTAALAESAVQIAYVGPSVATNASDGMNCLNAEAPSSWSVGKCVLWGEPHIKTFDYKEGSPVVDILAVGDYWLVRSEKISIQGRYRETQWTNGAAATSAIAIGGAFLQGHKLIVESMAGEAFWDGETILDTLPAEFSVEGVVQATFHQGVAGSLLDPSYALSDVKVVDLELPLGVRVSVNRWAQHVDVMITMRQQSGGQDGHCGNFNGDAADDTAEQIKQRMGEQVLAADLLFPEADPVEGTTRAPVTLDDCPADERERAEELCKESQLKETCIFDVCFGGEEFAGADAVMDEELGGQAKEAASLSK